MHIVWPVGTTSELPAGLAVLCGIAHFSTVSPFLLVHPIFSTTKHDCHGTNARKEHSFWSGIWQRTHPRVRLTPFTVVLDAVLQFGAANCSVYIRTNLLGKSPTTVLPYQHYFVYILTRSFKHVCSYCSYRMVVYCIAPSMHTAHQTTAYLTAAFYLYILNVVLQLRLNYWICTQIVRLFSIVEWRWHFCNCNCIIVDTFLKVAT